MDIQLRFVNKSLDGHQSEVLIFQKNLFPEMATLAMAWKVIRFCGYECYHPFSYPMDLEISVTDEHGNFTPRMAAKSGESLRLESLVQGGRWLRRAGKSATTTDLSVINAMGQGSVNVCAYRGGRLVGMHTAVAPGQHVVFRYQPVLWIGVASQVVQGSALDSAVVNSVNTELSLQGLVRADVVMSGGGSGEGAIPYEFSLENIVRS